MCAGLDEVSGSGKSKTMVAFTGDLEDLVLCATLDWEPENRCSQGPWWILSLGHTTTWADTAHRGIYILEAWMLQNHVFGPKNRTSFNLSHLKKYRALCAVWCKRRSLGGSNEIRRPLPIWIWLWHAVYKLRCCSIVYYYIIFSYFYWSKHY